MNETDLMRRFMPRMTDKNVRVFRRNVGAIETNHGGLFIAGIKGQCDVYGFVRGGYAFEVEFKAASGRVSEHQQKWKSFCESWEIPWLLLQAQRGETPEQTLDRWDSEFRDFISSICRAHGLS